MWRAVAACLAVGLVLVSAIAFCLITGNRAQAQDAPAVEGPWKVVKGVPVEQWVP